MIKLTPGKKKITATTYDRHAQHTARGPNVARRGFTFGPLTLDEIEYHKFNCVL